MCKALKIPFFKDKTSWVGGRVLLFCFCGGGWRKFQSCRRICMCPAANLDVSFKAGAVLLGVCFRKLTGGTQSWAGDEGRRAGL